MNDVACRQAVALGDFRLPGGTTAQDPAFLQKFRTGGRVNGAVLLRPSEYNLLLQELSIPGRDAVYETTLRRAATVT